jgi:hypothetical protein
VLECGALACEPGSPSDCLVAEIYDDGSAVFITPDESRRCTPYSIAAHSLYEEAHPQLQFYPEGVLSMAKTEFFAVDTHTAGIRKSRFYRTGKPWPLSIKLEGARCVGLRRVSLVQLDPADVHAIPDDILVYGRNGVQERHLASSERELGIIIRTRARTAAAADKLASLLAHYLIHYDYPGCESTAGNIAYPLSPNRVSFRYADGAYGAFVPSGTRDPVFVAKYASIRQGVVNLVRREFPGALSEAEYAFVEADAERPVALLRTVDRDADALARRHRAEIERIASVASVGTGSLLDIDATDAYEWTLYHLLQNEEVIRDRLFPIHYYRANGREWSRAGEARADYFDVGDPAGAQDLDDRTLSVIEDVPLNGTPSGRQRLLDMARVIRSKNTGINRLTFDVLFVSKDAYEAAHFVRAMWPTNSGSSWPPWSVRISSIAATRSRSPWRGESFRRRWMNAMYSAYNSNSCWSRWSSQCIPTRCRVRDDTTQCRHVKGLHRHLEARCLLIVRRVWTGKRGHCGIRSTTTALRPRPSLRTAALR